MKPAKYFMILIIYIISSCSLNSFNHDLFKSKHNENTLNDSGKLRPINIFEGSWNWIRTDGDGIAGPYVEDSTTTGYTLIYNFYDFTKLQTYKNDTKENLYDYHFTVSDSVEQQILTLTDLDGNDTEYLWKIESMEDNQFLYLTNPIPCCDNGFTMVFIRILSGNNRTY